VDRTVRIGDREVTRIGLGTNRLRGGRANGSFLTDATGAGLQFIDTAHVYTHGKSERTIGRALAPFADDLVVATKGGYQAGGGRGELRADVEESLERLGVDSIHLYYLHRVHPDLPIEEAMGVLGEYRDSGHIRHVGVSAVSVEQIAAAREVVEIAAVQNAYNLARREHEEVVDYCEREDIVFVPYYPLRGDGPPALTEIAARHDATPSQIKLAWLLRRSPVVAPIPGTLSLDHLNENLAALDIELSDEEFETLGP
jgi:aryl-alcohol dehydrogenase-like predicted oxidoreductase